MTLSDLKTSAIGVITAQAWDRLVGEVEALKAAPPPALERQFLFGSSPAGQSFFAGDKRLNASYGSILRIDPTGSDAIFEACVKTDRGQVRVRLVDVDTDDILLTLESTSQERTLVRRPVPLRSLRRLRVEVVTDIENSSTIWHAALVMK